MPLANIPKGTAVAVDATSPGGKRKMEFLSIQYLRALAALGVVLIHGSTSLLPHDGALLPLNIGNAGVDLFFVISGFLMFYTTANKTVSSVDFYVKRMIRVVPMYFLASTLAFGLALALPQFTRTFSPRLADYVRSIFFIPYYSTVNSTGDILHRLIRPEVGQGWTLNYEVFFYLAFGLVLGLAARRRVSALILWAAAMTTFGAIYHPMGAALRTYTDPLLLEFIAGVVLGFLVRKYAEQIQAWMGILLCVAGVAFLAAEGFQYAPGLRYIMFGLPALFIVGGAICIELRWGVPRVPLLLLLGNASYSLYLFHIFVLAILRRMWQQHFNVHLVRTHIFFILVGVVITEVIGSSIYLLVEQPITHALNGIFDRWKRSRTLAEKRAYT